MALAGDPPVVRPVNFVLDGDRIVIRTGPGALAQSAADQRLATFEIDHARNVDHRGWSVIASGRLSLVAADEDALTLPLRAWAHRGRDRFVAIHIDTLTGRRL